jgi:hypothetical protein
MNVGYIHEGAMFDKQRTYFFAELEMACYGTAWHGILYNGVEVEWHVM